MNAEIQTHPSNEPEHIESQTTTALAIVTQSITEINAFEAGITELERQYKGVVFEVSTTAGMDEACKARLAIRKPRYAIQKLGKGAKATLNELKDRVDERVESYITRIAVIEDPVHEQIENEIKRKAAIKEAARVAEQARIEGIQERINEIRESVTLAAGNSSETIQGMIASLVALPIDESFAEFKQRAETAKEGTLARLRAVYNNTLAVETEQKRLVDERAELARQKSAEELRLAQERERLAEEQRQAKKAVEAEAARQAEVLRRQRAEQEAEAARVLAEQEAAAARERSRIEEEDRQARLKREAEESAQQERLRRQREEDCRAADLERDRLAEESRRLDEQKREQERLQREGEEARKLREQRIGGINFIRAVVGMSSALETVAEFDSVIADTKSLDTSVDFYGDLSDEATSARDSTLDILQARRQILADRMELDAAASVSRETIVAPTDPVEATSAEDVQPATTSARAEAPERPSDEEIIDVVVQAFFVSEDVAWKWVTEMDVEHRKAA